MYFFIGDKYPKVASNKLHMLSMRFCPYAQRIHLVLDAKNISHHVIYINLQEKPEWLSKYSPLGKVPALGLANEFGTPFIYESLVVADYLDEKYSQVPLYSKDPFVKAMDRIWIKRFDDITKIYYQAIMRKVGQTTNESLTPISDGLDSFEEELKTRGSIFFGGVNPGMLDYMIWPFYERFVVLKYMFNYELDNKRFPSMVWFMYYLFF